MAQLISYEKTQNAIHIITEIEPDGSNANKHARLNAKTYLFSLSEQLSELAKLKPGSNPARYLNEYCVHLRQIASTVGLDGK